MLDEVKFVCAVIHGNLKVVLNPYLVVLKTESEVDRLLLQLSGGDEDYGNLYGN